MWIINLIFNFMAENFSQISVHVFHCLAWHNLILLPPSWLVTTDTIIVTIKQFNNMEVSLFLEVAVWIIVSSHDVWRTYSALLIELHLPSVLVMELLLNYRRLTVFWLPSIHLHQCSSLLLEYVLLVHELYFSPFEQPLFYHVWHGLLGAAWLRRCKW